MLRKYLLTTALLVLAVILCGYWYIAHPESWNRQFVERFSLTIADKISALLPVQAIGSATTPLAVQTPRRDAVSSGSEDVASVCSLPPTGEITRSAGTQLYSWRDEKGQLNFSDKPPSNGAPTSSMRVLEGELEYFTLDIQYRARRADFDIETPLKVQMRGIYRVFTSLLGFDALRKTHVNIVLHPDKDTYHRAARLTTGYDMSTYDGHYSSRNNQAETYLHADNEATMVTVRHEAVHVITTGILGFAPPWLNEGLSEYFEHLSVTGMSSQVHRDEWQFRRVQNLRRSGSHLRLRDFMAVQQSAWRGENQNAHYAMAWGLVYFLMENPRRRQALSALLQGMSRSFCQRFETIAQLDALYPGGLPALERDYFAWVDGGQARAVHQY